MEIPKITHWDIIKIIQDLCKTNESFTDRGNTLFSMIGEINKESLIYYLNMAGSIPELYSHDSAEEKLYAKYCDFLVFNFFKFFGYEATLCEERSDYADVIGKTKEFTVVADAKAFRLSRTALNPKDYKIEALNGWRKKANGQYACLVAPLNEFPKDKSRLYREAIRFNILMISYSHLSFMLSLTNHKKLDWINLWDIKKIFGDNIKINGKEYWKTIENQLLKITFCKREELEKFKIEGKKATLNNIEVELSNLNAIITSIDKMDKKEIEKMLLDKLGITNKINQILRKKKFLQGTQDTLL